VAEDCAVELSPDILALVVVNHEKVVPAMDEAKATFGESPEQILCGLGVAEATGAVQEQLGEEIFVNMVALQMD
jgi:hypothetical protein